jgi:hypothetical protein
MILRLILRDRTIRRLLPWLPLGVLIGFMLASNQQDAVRHGLTTGAHGFQGFRYVAYLPWGAIGFALFYGGIAVRCERLDAALPISYRALWLARALALVLSAWALIGTMAVTLWLRNWIEGFQVVGRTQVGSLFAQLAAASALAVVLARLPRPALQALALKPGTSLYLALVWAGNLGLIFLLAGDPPGYALLPGVVALGLGLWTYFSLPASPLITPGEPEVSYAPAIRVTPRKADGGESIVDSATGSRWLVRATIWRTCYGHWASWLVLAMFLLLLFGLARPDPASGLNGLSAFVVLWLLLSVSFGLATSRLHALDPLPISRKRIFACAVLPGLLVASLGYLGAMALRTGWEQHTALVDYRRHPVVGDVDVRVPLAFWEIGWDGEPSPVEEPYVPPWEEPHYPWSARLYKGFSPVLYLPYHVPEGSPPQTVAEQLSRAVEAVYGKRVPASEMQRRYLSANPDGSTAVRPGGLTLQEDYGLKPILWLRTAPLGVLFTGLPWLLTLALTVRGGYIRVAARRRPRAPLLIAGLLALCLLGSLWSYNAGYTAAWKLTALAHILLRKLSLALPGGPLAWWGIAVVLYGGAYLLAQARFERIEAPARAQDGFAWT